MTATHPYAQFLGDRDPFEVLAETQVKNSGHRAGARNQGPDAHLRTRKVDSRAGSGAPGRL